MILTKHFSSLKECKENQPVFIYLDGLHDNYTVTDDLVAKEVFRRVKSSKRILEGFFVFEEKVLRYEFNREYQIHEFYFVCGLDELSDLTAK